MCQFYLLSITEQQKNLAKILTVFLDKLLFPTATAITVCAKIIIYWSGGLQHFLVHKSSFVINVAFETHH
jgi:hypothetical protein